MSDDIPGLDVASHAQIEFGGGRLVVLPRRPEPLVGDWLCLIRDVDFPVVERYQESMMLLVGSLGGVAQLAISALSLGSAFRAWSGNVDERGCFIGLHSSFVRNAFVQRALVWLPVSARDPYTAALRLLEDDR